MCCHRSLLQLLLYQELTRLGIVVILAHPLKTRAIADAKVKNDRLDANMLCDLLRADLIPQSYIPSERIRYLRELTRQHVRLVQIRTKIKNQFHSLLTRLNLRPTEPMTDIFGLKGRNWLKQMQLPDVFDFQNSSFSINSNTTIVWFIVSIRNSPHAKGLSCAASGIKGGVSGTA